MDIKIVNNSTREIPEEFIESIKNEEGYNRYQKILEEYNLKFAEIDLNFKEDITTFIIKNKE